MAFTTTLPHNPFPTGAPSSAPTVAGPSGLGGATVASQFVVVAIVACGVFAAVVITIMYRRRRAPHPGVEEWAWGGPGTRLLVDNGNGVLVQVQPPRRKRKKLGPEPTVWDAQLELRDEKEDDEVEAWSVSWGWELSLPQPLGVALPSNPDPFNPAVDVTVLIAMPEQPRDGAVDEFDFPPLEMGTFIQPVAADPAELRALRPPKAKKREETAREETEEQPHRVRVDGFRRFRRAYA